MKEEFDIDYDRYIAHLQHMAESLEPDDPIRKRLDVEIDDVQRERDYEPGEEEFVTKSGRVLTNEDFERLADEAEQGYDLDVILRRRDAGIQDQEG